jgi:hypothetical protein
MDSLSHDVEHNPRRIKAHMIAEVGRTDPHVVQDPDDIFYTLSFRVTTSGCYLEGLLIPEEVVACIRRIHEDDKYDIFFIPHDEQEIRITRSANLGDPDDIMTSIGGSSFVDIATTCPQILTIAPSALFTAESVRSIIIEP